MIFNISDKKMKQFNCSVRAHSRHHLELKTEYPLISGLKKTRYRMDLYFFSPSQLNINDARIGVKELINKIKIYTRLSTPVMSLTMLTDKENNLSPLNRIRTIIETPAAEQSTKKDKLLYELQVLTKLYRAELENTVELNRIEVEKQNLDRMCRKKRSSFLTEINSFLKDFRKLHPKFISPQITDIQRTALSWADESISIITERSLNRLFSLAEIINEDDSLCVEIERITRAETEYRRAMGYEYLYNEKNAYMGELLAYRENVLKKWSQSAMYMTKEESRNNKRAGHILAGTAAGVAMLFAVFVTIFAGRIFIPNTTPWILAIIVSYIFKDRIKEILRDSFKKIIPKVTSDQMSLLYDNSSDKQVGTARAYAKFTKAGNAPSDIFQLRNNNPNPFQSILPEQDLIHYQRIIELNSEELTRHHSRLTSTTEIIRFNISDWLNEMDDPKDIFYRLENKKKIKIKGNRVYKIHLIIHLRNDHIPGNEEFYHYCIIINKAGILRIEEA